MITDIDVPAHETGLLKEIHVVENQAVELGQILANMDDQKSQRILETAQLKHDLATRKAEDPTKILSAEEKVKLTSIEYEVNLKLYSKGSKTKQDALRSKYSRDISKFDLQRRKVVAFSLLQNYDPICSYLGDSRLLEVFLDRNLFTGFLVARNFFRLVFGLEFDWEAAANLAYLVSKFGLFSMDCTCL